MSKRAKSPSSRLGGAFLFTKSHPKWVAFRSFEWGPVLSRSQTSRLDGGYSQVGLIRPIRRMGWRNPFSRWSNYQRTLQTGDGILILPPTQSTIRLLLGGFRFDGIIASFVCAGFCLSLTARYISLCSDFGHQLVFDSVLFGRINRKPLLLALF